MRPSQLRNLGITRLLRATEGMGSNGPVPKANLLPVTGPQVKVLIIGAGNINFGSEEGPWNHSQRLERKLGTRLKVIGLVDPAVARAQAVLEAKSLTFAAPAYSSTEIYASVQAAVSGLSSEPPDVIILGSPPAFRGTTDASKGFDTEVQLSSGFPSSALFVEKPVSTGLVEEVRLVADLLETRKGNLVSVGYMLRYSAAVRKMKEIIKENELNVMMTSARYIMAYEASRKLAWWDKRIDGGPIVEQATHFCDLSRYFGGEVDLDSVMAHSLEWYEKPGHLSKIQVNELQIPEDERIPRFTSATWKYESDFNTELAVYADGYLLKLVDPYNRPTLYVRRPGSDSEEVHAFHDDDPFLSEMSSFIDMATTGKAEVPILSSYADAVRTYEMTWAIRWASEKTRRLRT